MFFDIYEIATLCCHKVSQQLVTVRNIDLALGVSKMLLASVINFLTELKLTVNIIDILNHAIYNPNEFHAEF